MSTTIKRSIDVEDAVRQILADAGITAYCRPLPKDFSMPSVLVQSIGGNTEENWSGFEVMDNFTVVLDSRAETENNALLTLRNAIGVLKTAAAGQNSVIRYVALNTQYSWGADPVRPDIAMCSANLSITAHSESITI